MYDRANGYCQYFLLLFFHVLLLYVYICMVRVTCVIIINIIIILTSYIELIIVGHNNEKNYDYIYFICIYAYYLFL